MRLKDEVNKQELNIKFDEYIELENGWFPNKRTIELIAPNLNYTIGVSYIKASLDQEVQFPFNVPTSYTRK